MKNRSGMHVALCSMAVCAVLLATASDPQVTDVSTADTAGNIISVSYRLTGAPAVVTFAVETNAGENV